MPDKFIEEAKKLIFKWREQAAGDAGDYYAEQYSRAEDCADELEKLLKLLEVPDAG